MNTENNECLFPACKRHAEKNGYCIGHGIYANSSGEVKTAKAIAPRSDKMKETMKSLKKDYALFLSRPENKRCQVKMDEGCTKIATAVHHTEGRDGANLTDQSKWMASCHHCNIQVEIKDAVARDKGVKKSKHTPNYKRTK